MLRSTPFVTVYRPCDANETNYAFVHALENTDNPSVIVLSRQNLEVKTPIKYSDFKKGGYVIKDRDNFQGILIAAGSEVALALDAQDALDKQGIPVRVVSMPSMELFKKQSKRYQETVLPHSCQKRLAIEMGTPDLWYQFASHVKGINRFGVSAPMKDATNYFGFDVKTIVALYKKL